MSLSLLIKLWLHSNARRPHVRGGVLVGAEQAGAMYPACSRDITKPDQLSGQWKKPIREQAYRLTKIGLTVFTTNSVLS
jgi:hypothetical protein